MIFKIIFIFRKSSRKGSMADQSQDGLVSLINPNNVDFNDAIEEQNLEAGEKVKSSAEDKKTEEW